VLGPELDQKRREVERLMSKVITLTNQPPEVRTVEKRIEVPVERVVVKRVEVPVEKVVDRLIDNPEQLARIKALEREVAVIAGLLTKIAQLSTPSDEAAGETIIGERVEASVEKGVEKVVDRPVDNPEQLARIKALEDEVVVIAGLRAQLQATPSQTSETVVEPRSETPAEPNDGAPLNMVSRPAVDLAGAGEPSDAGQAVRESPDNLKHIRGVGPALERFLHKRGVFWFRQVATWSQADIDKFEFLLPNFSGRIQREHWVHSARVAHYKKYQQWLGDGEPPSESPDLHAQSAERQAMSSQASETVVEPRGETSAEPNDGAPLNTVSGPAVGLAEATEPSEEGQTGGASPDDLKDIRGVGPALERFLHKRGVFWFKQVATWSQADIDKFEFLLPNFSGRIQREHWVRSARVAHYKKYQQWLGDGEPPSESPDLHAQSAERQATSSQASETVVEPRSETSAEPNDEAPLNTVSGPAVGLAGATEPSEDGQTGGASPDDLKDIRGVGPALERFLHKRGVFWFKQVATWSQADIDKFEFLLPNFSGRIQRENWVQNAQIEYYKKYKKWLGDDGPPSTTPDIP
jgi:predicted flap endonuclease-1-like 5' DNA nuclease